MKILGRVIAAMASSALCFNMALAEGADVSPEEKVSVEDRSGDEDSGLGQWGDPGYQLQVIKERNQRLSDNPENGLIPYSLIQPLRDSFGGFKKELYDNTGLNIGLSMHTVGQLANEVLDGFDNSAIATDFDFVGTWELLNVGAPTQGEVFFGLEGRWDYFTDGPQNLGFANLGTAGGTANTFSRYSDPYAFLMRNLYWRQGSAEAGWAYRIGKITVDSLFSGSRHLSPNDAFLPNAGTGMFANAFADSGLGAVGALYFGDSVYVAGGISDANGNRSNFGDISKGDFYKVAELGLKLLPLTEKATFSKFSIWHTDGTSDGMPINANTGSDGWGYSIVLQQELTRDGNLVAVGRYGQSFDGAAIYDRQAGAHLVYYNPFGFFAPDTESIGAAFNWIDSTFDGTRDEYNFEAFYRFPLFPDVEASFSYQHINHPAFTTDLDSANVFSFRLTTSL
jgi:porin